MSKTIKLKKGFDIRLVGKAEKKLISMSPARTFALKPTDFLGMQRPKVTVSEGDTVKAGTPILFDKALDKVQYVAPVSGEVIEIKRGDRRKLLEIKILADSSVDFEVFEKFSDTALKSLSKDQAIDHMCKGGVWPQIIQRPYGIVANPAETPKSIFVSCFDTHPLAADYGFTLQGGAKYFQAGVEVLKKLTKGKVNVNINGEGEVAPVFANVAGAETNKISGPHPAGNVGTQIHHLDPINKGDLVWTVSPYGVVQIGKLFLDGKYDASRIIAVTGSEAKTTGYVKTFTGSNVESYVNGNTQHEHVRVISGNVLTGEKIEANGYLGFYSSQITLIPEGEYEEFLGWLKPSTTKLSFHKALGLFSFLNKNKEYVVDTNTHGEERPFVVTGAFEQVMPMDILPTYLFKAIVAEDFDEMEELGLYELVEEDVALCEFIDPSKNELQKMLRNGIELLMYS